MLPTAYCFQGFAMIARSERDEIRKAPNRTGSSIHIHYCLKHLVSQAEVIECRIAAGPI
jgi:hypothetical protein